MKLYCSHCEKEVKIFVIFSGPHLKAMCITCSRYIKFLNKTEKRTIEAEEDSNAKTP